MVASARGGFLHSRAGGGRNSSTLLSTEVERPVQRWEGRREGPPVLPVLVVGFCHLEKETNTEGVIRVTSPTPGLFC